MRRSEVRYKLLTVGLASALFALFAGAYGDLSSWQRDWPGVVAWMTAASRGTISWTTTTITPVEADPSPQVGALVSGPAGDQAARPADAPVAPTSQPSTGGSSPAGS